MTKIIVSIKVPEQIKQAYDADFHQIFSLRVEPKTLPVVTDVSGLNSSLKNQKDTRYRIIRCRISSNTMTVLDSEREVPVMLYDNLQNSPEINFQILNKHQEVEYETQLQYQMSKDNLFPKITLPDQVLEMTPQEILEEPWEYLSQPIQLTTTALDNSFQGLLHVRVAGNPKTCHPLTVFGNRPYALFAMELFIDETLLGLEASSEVVEDKPKLVLGKDIKAFCEKYNHPVPANLDMIYPEGRYVPVDQKMVSGSPVINQNGEMVGMVMFPGWGRLFTQKDLDLINHASPLVEKAIDSESDADSDPELPPTAEL